MSWADKYRAEYGRQQEAERAAAAAETGVRDQIKECERMVRAFLDKVEQEAVRQFLLAANNPRGSSFGQEATRTEAGRFGRVRTVHVGTRWHIPAGGGGSVRWDIVVLSDGSWFYRISDNYQPSYVGSGNYSETLLHVGRDSGGRQTPAAHPHVLDWQLGISHEINTPADLQDIATWIIRQRRSGGCCRSETSLPDLVRGSDIVPELQLLTDGLYATIERNILSFMVANGLQPR